MVNTLITRDSKGKCRVVKMELIHNENDTYTIKRSSGLFGGKITNQPELTIEKGKVKRNTQEQAELEYKSILKKFKDKGYKDIIDLGIVNLTEDAINEKLPAEKTDQNGSLKPMLCKVFDKTNKKNLETVWLSSYKLDGTRAFLFLKDGEIRTSSRGGGDYDIPATYIREDPFVKAIFKENPDIILDGEIYRHGWHLSKISGLCRKEELLEDHKELKFYCYDIVDTTQTFATRAARLGQYQYYANRLDTPSRIIFVQHLPVKGLPQIQEQHDKAVSEGYEGLVVRDPKAMYKCGARDLRMQKLKTFIDNEFKIKGLAEGLREEDMCFIMETSEGYEFKAKPVGTREDKKWYRDNIESLIGKMGTVKYFGMTNTDKPVPNLPVMKSIRYDYE